MGDGIATRVCIIMLVLKQLGDPVAVAVMLTLNPAAGQAAPTALEQVTVTLLPEGTGHKQ